MGFQNSVWVGARRGLPSFDRGNLTHSDQISWLGVILMACLPSRETSGIFLSAFQKFLNATVAFVTHTVAGRRELRLVALVRRTSSSVAV